PDLPGCGPVSHSPWTNFARAGHAEIERALASDVDFLCDVVAAVGGGKPGGHMPPPSSLLTLFVPTLGQTTLIDANLGSTIMTASPALIGLMDQHGCPQVGYPPDSSSWIGCDGMRRSPLFARGSRALRRASIDARSREETVSSHCLRGGK